MHLKKKNTFIYLAMSSVTCLFYCNSNIWKHFTATYCVYNIVCLTVNSDSIQMKTFGGAHKSQSTQEKNISSGIFRAVAISENVFATDTHIHIPINTQPYRSIDMLIGSIWNECLTAQKTPPNTHKHAMPFQHLVGIQWIFGCVDLWPLKLIFSVLASQTLFA